jgi:C4-dicarboxylate-specific signal transduction histidine kinase
MSSEHNNPSESAAAPPTPDAATHRSHDVLPQRVAHEMANLLDGSLRNLGLAIHSLREPIDAQDQAAASDDALLDRLEATDHAMKQMVSLVNQLRSGGATPADFGRTQTLAEAVDHAIHLLQPAADASGTALRVKFEPAAARQPVGPLYPVILNILRNSLEAIETTPTDHREPPWVEITGQVQRDMLTLRITDNGPGLDDTLFDDHGVFRFGVTTRADGHGIGLQLARETVAALQGTLDLKNTHPHGLRLTLSLPVPKP